MMTYYLKQFIRDLLLKLGNPLNIVSFSPQHRMLINLKPYDSVLHIGANVGQEFSLYHLIGPERVIWIEPDKVAFKKLKLKGVFYRKFESIYIQACISDKTGIAASFYKFNESGANSNFKPTNSFLESRKTRYITEISLITTKNIEDALIDKSIKFLSKNNLLVIDVQGNEMSVINGFRKETLEKFRVIMCEFSQGQYENSISPALLKSRLEYFGYTEVLAPIRSSDDAIFVRKD
jgi:FkbM family methyltransferase